MVLLQSGIPGGPELLVLLLLVGVIYLILPFALAYWVYADAKDYETTNGAWWALFVWVVTFGTLVGGFLAVWVYTLKRDQGPARPNSPPSG